MDVESVELNEHSDEIVVVGCGLLNGCLAAPIAVPAFVRPFIDDSDDRAGSE